MIIKLAQTNEGQFFDSQHSGFYFSYLIYVFQLLTENSIIYTNIYH